ncbi:hypothetical protein CDD81_8006 [Ophiocordyceps australis]|uniref:Triacylglycerol lipase n=1 Tax=Ophiocordyceps australis TaxID=1399860 RepID=A0A2C5Y433_9HYPO|nr:hypothetical protein CDD81_8006 [Ophiocordyceps australis]
MALFVLHWAVFLASVVALAAVPPSQDGFYAVPGNVDSVRPGAILRHRNPPTSLLALNKTLVSIKAAHQILYRTTDSFGNATATVTTILVPQNADMSKVLSYQIPEDSSSTSCAPSYALQLEDGAISELDIALTNSQLLFIQAALQQGWVVLVPDHEGPQAAFLANVQAGHAVLDGMRAAINSACFTGISKCPKLTMWGYSGGSLATNWAAELQPSYAPELDISGAAVGGTVPNISAVIVAVNKQLGAGLVPAGILGLANEYPDFKVLVHQQLRPEVKDKFYKPLSQCIVANGIEFAFQDILGYFKDPMFILNNPISTRVIEENNLGKSIPHIPFYWYQGVKDEISPVQFTDDLVSKYCAEGVSIEFHRQIGATHGDNELNTALAALSWLKDRMDGKQSYSGCTRDDVQITLLDSPGSGLVSKELLDSLVSLTKESG